MKNNEELCRTLMNEKGLKQETHPDLEIGMGKPDNITVLTNYIESVAESKEEIEFLLQFLEVCLCSIDQVS